MSAELEAYHELLAYTLTHPDPGFLHQHAVDAFAAQRATPEDKPIKVAFALVGLHLQLERGFTGREVQRAHGRLARTGRGWPTFPLPADRGTLTVREVVAAAPGAARDGRLREWCVSVWAAYAAVHERVEQLLAERGVT